MNIKHCGQSKKKVGDNMISRGVPARFTSTKGSWGDGYIIEKNTYSRKRVSCADCKHYYEDGSCLKEAVNRLFSPKISTTI